MFAHCDAGTAASGPFIESEPTGADTPEKIAAIEASLGIINDDTEALPGPKVEQQTVSRPPASCRR